jgi:Flp pilus assembly protein TadB
LIVGFILFLLLSSAAVLIFGLTPEQITADIMKLTGTEQSLRHRAGIAKGSKKERKIAAALTNIQKALTTTGKGGSFAMVCTLSLGLFIAGCVLCLMIGNPFLMPVAGASMAMIPFGYARSVVSSYDKHVREELETALSIITTSYARNDNIVGSVRENLDYIKQPVRDIFKGFVGETTIINADVKAAIRNLRTRIDNEIFREWCDMLLSCQNDRTLKSSLLPIVHKLTDVRIINNEMRTILFEPRKEYWVMAIMVAGNIPLLYLLNKDWFHTLMFTLPGKITLAISGTIIFVTAILMMRYTRPIQFRR